MELKDTLPIRTDLGTVVLTKIIRFFDETYFEDADGFLGHIPYKLRGVLSVNESVIIRVCQYKKHRYDSSLDKNIFDGEPYICSSVQAHGTEKEMMNLWNADEVLTREVYKNTLTRHLPKNG